MIDKHLEQYSEREKSYKFLQSIELEDFNSNLLKGSISDLEEQLIEETANEKSQIY